MQRNGQLGDGTTTNRNSPIEVTALGNDNVQVEAGHTYTVVLKTDGRILTFGDNECGQLGDGTNVDRSTPVEATAFGNENAQVVAGNYQTLVLKMDGRIMACGRNNYGQLGDATNTDRVNPIELTALGMDNAQVAAGEHHTVVRKTDGRIMTFGYKGNGQLGDGTTTDRNSPTELTSLGNDNTQVAAGKHHTVVLKSDGLLMTFGYNGNGQLGDGTNTERNTPVETTALGNDIVEVVAGGSQTMVLTANKQVKTFGRNTFGALGDSTTTDRSNPILVASLDNVAQMAVGYYHSIVLKRPPVRAHRSSLLTSPYVFDSALLLPLTAAAPRPEHGCLPPGSGRYQRAHVGAVLRLGGGRRVDTGGVSHAVRSVRRDGVDRRQLAGLTFGGYVRELLFFIFVRAVVFLCNFLVPSCICSKSRAVPTRPCLQSCVFAGGRIVGKEWSTMGRYGRDVHLQVCRRRRSLREVRLERCGHELPVR